MMGTFTRRPMLLGLFVTLAAELTLTASAGAAESWSTWARLPTMGSRVSGFTCEVRTVDPGGYGYLPLELTATSTTGRFSADRRIVVDLEPTAGANWPQPQTAYRFELLLPEGQTSVRQQYYLPKYFAGASFRLAMSESGGRLVGYATDLSGSAIDGMRAAASQERMSKYAILLPDVGTTTGADWERVPDMRTIDSITLPEVAFLTSAEPQRMTDAEALQQLQLRSLPRRQVLRTSHLHHSWLGYEGVDIVIVGFPLLERLRDDHPERLAALRDWVACGGAVWTYGVDSPDDVARMFDTEVPPPGHPAVAGRVAEGVASFVPVKMLPVFDWGMQQMRDQNWTGEEEAYLGRAPTERWEELRLVSHPAAEMLNAAEMEQHIFAQPVLAGIVVGMRDADPFPGSFQLWHVAQHLTADRQAWELKHGSSPLVGSDSFWDWTLENVARPPVYAFLGVLTGFVLLVGPVSYHLTRRRGRTYLMFCIAPVLATVATLMLFGYGLLADGLGTQVRIRQITWLDGGSGGAARLTRSTYFAGFRPGGGLRFPRQAAVYPIVDVEEGFQRSGYGSPPRVDRQITVDAEHQHFNGDFLPARRQRQFVATEPLPEVGSVMLLESPGQSPRLRSSLDTEIRTLLLRDSQGEYFMTSQPLSPEGEASLDAVAQQRVPGILRGLYDVEDYGPPLGFSPSHSSNWLGRRHYYQMGIGQQQFYNQSWYHPNAPHGVFEGRLRMMLRERVELPPGWFVGIAELTPGASAVEGATPVSSVHYVMGSL